MVEERNSFEQGELPARLRDLLCDLLLDGYLDLAPLPIGAGPLSMPLVATGLAPPSLRLGAILPDMSMLLTVEALDLAAPLIHEDRHFYWSSTSWYQGYGLWGVLLVRDDWCTEHAPHLYLEGVIQTRPLNVVHAIHQFVLDDEILLLNL